MNISGRTALVSLVLSALVGWLGFVIVWAGYIFVLPHGPHFAPEVGPSGAFVIFGLVYSFFYLLDFLLIAVPCFLLLYYPRIQSRPLLRGICGAVMFSLTVPFWFFLSRTDTTDMGFCIVFAAVAGAASFIMLRPSTFSANAA
jgi:hypothetical protein